MGTQREEIELGQERELDVEVLPSGVINVHCAPSTFLSYKGVEDISESWHTPTDRTDRILTWEALIDIWATEAKNKTDESNS